jgi:hypothetical protein
MTKGANYPGELLAHYDVHCAYRGPPVTERREAGQLGGKRRQRPRGRRIMLCPQCLKSKREQLFS